MENLIGKNISVIERTTMNGGMPTWAFQTVKPLRFDAVFGIMDDFGNFQEILWGRAILRDPGAWW